MSRKTRTRVLLTSATAAAVAATAGSTFAQGFGGGPVVVGGYLVNGGGFAGNGIGYYNGSFGGYGGYGGFRGGGFGPYGGFNGADFWSYRFGGFETYPNYGEVAAFALPPAYQPPHLITAGVEPRTASSPPEPTNIAAGADRRKRAAAARPNGFNAYGRYHASWLHGYWNGARNAAWDWWPPDRRADRSGIESGLGWGLPLWAFGSSVYGMGYLPYSNPYSSAALAANSPHDYARPIDTTTAAADEAAAAPAQARFDAGRAAFKQENYGEALARTDEALKQLPGDTAAHEFRALCLFALARYDEAAATLYAVLAVGPGWDWTTMVGLYPNIDVYTAQLRALEAHCRSHDSAGAWFVLAYHYLTQGFPDAAAEALGRAARLKPDDALGANLLRLLDARRASAPRPPVAAAVKPPVGATIEGVWTAAPGAGLAVSLTITADGRFTWSVDEKGQAPPRTFTGKSTFSGGILTLVRDQGPALVGRVSWSDPARMTFRIVGEGPNDPGLSFSK